MKISQLLQVVLVSSFVAVPVMAADAPVSLCGDKVEKAEKSDKNETTVKSDKKNDKKEGKQDKSAAKGSV